MENAARVACLDPGSTPGGSTSNDCGHRSRTIGCFEACGSIHAAGSGCPSTIRPEVREQNQQVTYPHHSVFIEVCRAARCAAKLCQQKQHVYHRN